ncbi:MAG: hypothetical protein QF745_08000 [Planctomycetota bacterium]|nr:hypothetical protein [Planctomycetota bacterium]
MGLPDDFNACAPNCFNVHRRSSDIGIGTGLHGSSMCRCLRGLDHLLEDSIRVRHIDIAKVHPSFLYTLLQNCYLSKPLKHIMIASVEPEDLHEAPQEY